MTSSLAKRLSAPLAALSIVLVIAVNALANILPINGVGTGQVSAEFGTLFAPAGLTFSIWGLIYLLLVGHAAALLAEAFGRRPEGLWSAADGLILALNAGLNSAWIFAWHYRLIPLSFMLMLGILGSLVLLEERRFKAERGAAARAAGAGAPASGEADRAPLRGARAFLLRVPLLVYLGWISVATIANAAAALVALGLPQTGTAARAATALVILAGAAVAALLLLRRRALSPLLVAAWAFLGIVLERLRLGDPADGPIVAVAAASALGLLALAAFVRLRKAPA